MQMKTIICPHCGKPAMSLFRKISLGNMITVRCASCGQKVGQPGVIAGFHLLLLIALIMAIVYVDLFLLKVVVLTGFMLLWIFVEVKFGYLEVRT
jgi:hypothetical protein